MIYNKAFFGLFENVFNLLKQEYGEEKALELFSELMMMGLSRSYGNDFKRGDLAEFERMVGERDRAVGLKVKFIKNAANELIYQFYDDPFPNLRGVVDSQKLDRCYMVFKIRYILGDEWSYRTTKHLWNGDQYTEHHIYKVK